ncbi:MAG: signal peptidase II [Planctomycetia bacterium]|nr:signal peptidase II [Planctomycetia bacterium]
MAARRTGAHLRRDPRQPLRPPGLYAVRDWIHVTIPGVIDWPIFNLADSWLVIGAGMLLLASFRSPAATEPALPV